MDSELANVMYVFQSDEQTTDTTSENRTVFYNSVRYSTLDFFLCGD